MRLSGMNDRGSVLVFFMITIPLFVALLALLIDSGRIIVQRARLKSSANRAAYAGAASIADSMNRIAAENWTIHHAWRELEEDFRKNSQQSEQAANQKKEKYKHIRDESLKTIGEIHKEMFDRAKEISSEIFKADTPGALYSIYSNNNIAILDDENPNQYGMTDFGYIEGDIFTDPENVGLGSYRGLKYLTKFKSPDALISVEARQIIKPKLISRLNQKYVNEFIIDTDTSAKAFGGSIEAFARKETATLSEAEQIVEDGGFDGLYRATLIP